MNDTESNRAKLEAELESKLTSVEYFFKDIESHTRNIQEAEKLYREVKEAVDNAKRAGALGTKFDMSKVYENLIRLRANIGEMLARRSSVVATYDNIIFKKKKDDDIGDKFGEIVRQLQSKFAEEDSGVRKSTSDRINNKKVEADAESISELEKRIEEEMNQGSIKLTKNERAMAFDFKGGIEIVYDVRSEEFIPYYKEEKRILGEEEYPRERIPNKRLLEIRGNRAITKDGGSHRLYNGELIDD